LDRLYTVLGIFQFPLPLNLSILKMKSLDFMVF
jgi:hypothetical protein